jgi:hypothetical protein
MAHRPLVRAALVAASAVMVAAPAARADNPPPGDIPDNQAYVKYTGAGYSLKVPDGWARKGAGVHVTFFDKYNSIGVDTSAARSAPTMASVKRVDIAQLKTSTKGFKNAKVTHLTRPAGPVVVLSYQDTSKPNAVTGKTVTEDVQRYVFWRHGKQIAVTLAAPAGSDNVDPWRIVTTSFHWA